MADISASVTVITVIYNSAAVLPVLLASIPPCVRVVVVDNASTDNGAQIVATRPGATLHRIDRNLGFGVACNRGAALSETPWLLFLNPDSRLEPDTIPKLLAAAARYPARSVLNPRILYDDGQTNLRAPSRFLGRGRGERAPQPQADMPINVLSGAAIFMRRDHFAEIGGFDENIFLYFEDDDLSLRLLAAGFVLHHVHDAIVQHEGGQASPSSPGLTRFKNYHWMRSYQYVAQKHGARAGRLLLVAMSAWRWSLAAVTLSHGERHKYEGRLRALLGL